MTVAGGSVTYLTFTASPDGNIFSLLSQSRIALLIPASERAKPTAGQVMDLETEVKVIRD